MDRGNVKSREGLPVGERIKGWPTETREAAEAIISRYGWPHKATRGYLHWDLNAPWRWTTVFANGSVHEFPGRHIDVVKQAVGFRVPEDKIGLISKFSRSLRYDSAAEELVAFCGNEKMNLVWLNLAHDIIRGAKTVEEAQEAAGKMLHCISIGWPDNYAAEFLFVTADDLLDY